MEHCQPRGVVTPEEVKSLGRRMLVALELNGPHAARAVSAIWAAQLLGLLTSREKRNDSARPPQHSRAVIIRD